MAVKNAYSLIRDLMVKIKPVYLKDIYIIKHKYLISGESSKLLTAGRFLCILSEKYEEALREITDVKEEDIIYISDIVEIKTSLDEERFEFKVIDKKNTDYDKIMNDKSLIPLMERVDKVEDWRCLTEDFPDVTKTIYKDKHVFSIPVNDGKDCINIGKSIIPILTEKTISNSEYCINYLDDLSLYEVLIRYQHTHFKIYMQYFAVTMKLLEE